MANLTRNCSNMEQEIVEMDAQTIPETIPSFPQSSGTDKSGIESELITFVPSPVNLTLTPPTARGGFTCCVPHCFNNSKKDKALSFYRIPKDKTLRKVWLHKISRKDFEPTDGHRVCSAHFVGGKKTYMNNVPLIVPKTVKPVQPKPRQTLASSGNRGRPLVEINMNTNDTEIENEQPLLGEIQEEESHQCEKQIYRYEEEIASLKQKIHDMEVSHKRSIDVLQGEIKELKKKNFSQSFTIENAKETRDMLQFYTGLPDYETFETLFNYLGPAVKNLVYIGSNTVGSKIDSETYIK